MKAGRDNNRERQTTVKIGKNILLLVLCWAATLPPAWSAVSLKADRTQVVLGDSLTITIKATEGEDLKIIDLRSLRAAFDIVGSSSRSNITIVNGEFRSVAELILSVIPKQKGNIEVGPVVVDNIQSNSVTITVEDPGNLPAGASQTVFITGELDKESPHVQEQIIYTLSIYSAVTLQLDNETLSDLDIDDALVTRLGQARFGRKVSGMDYEVVEIKYAIFPQRSGAIRIPEQIFEADQILRTRGFGLGQRRPIYHRSNALTIEVKPAKIQSGSVAWLPASNFSVSEEWSKDPSTLSVGESATRTITLLADGLMATQLPPVLTPSLDGLKIYPEAPRLEDEPSGTGVRSRRFETSAVVAAEPGEFELPGIEFTWWNTAADREETVSLPSRMISISPAAESQLAVTNAFDEGVTTVQNSDITPVSQQVQLWQQIAYLAIAAWLFTLLAWWRNRHSRSNSRAAELSQRDESESKAWRELKAACKDRDARRTRAALSQWATVYFVSTNMGRISALQSMCTVDADRSALANLDAHLFRGDAPPDFDAILRAAEALKASKTTPVTGDTDLAPLYRGSP